MPNNTWSTECMTPESAILMHAALVFPVEIHDAPWLGNLKPVSPDSYITNLTPIPETMIAE
ncbi:hypothetical protein [Neoasaia chiangmaiensis]|nr:hypothetical protein [Neoasaia chiangmaiensis]